MIIDHIGIAVKSLEDGIQHWNRVFGYEQMTEIVTNTLQKVRVVFLSKKNSLTVKLIEPSDKSSPIYAFTQRGGGLHHLCFICGNVKEKTIELKDMGLKVLVEPQSGEAFDNEKIAFIYANYGLIIELIDTHKRAGSISGAE